MLDVCGIRDSVRIGKAGFYNCILYSVLHINVSSLSVVCTVVHVGNSLFFPDDHLCGVIIQNINR